MHKKRFQRKIILANLSVIVLLMISLLVVFYWFFIRSEKEQTISILSSLCTKQQKQLDDMIHNLDSITLHVACNPSIVELFEDLPDQDGNYFATNHMVASSLRSMLSSYVFDNYGFERICLYNDKGDFLYTGSRETKADTIEGFFASERFQNIQSSLAARHGRLFLNVSLDPFQRSSDMTEQGLIFSIVREIKNYMEFDNKVSGYVEIQQSADEVGDLFRSLDPSMSGYLIDRSSGDILYPSPQLQSPNPDHERLCRDMLARFREANDTKTVTTGGRFAACRNLSELDCMLVLVQDESTALQSLYQFILITLATLLLILIIVCITETLIMRRLTRPLNQLTESVKQISLENFSIHFDSNGSDELENLNLAFHNMFETLNQSIEELVESRTSQLESSLLALQAQVNPHFIHNTLALISAIAEENDTPKITGICNNLSDMLRFTTSYKSTVCPLREEISYAECYLRLMRERYDTLFSFSLEMDESLEEICIPKLVLYPLLENCFSHAFKPVRPPWEIRVRVWKQQNHWIIEVTDNGVGFDEQSLRSVCALLEELKKEDCMKQLSGLEIGGLCIRSTILRLRLHYGEEMIFEVGNRKQGGSRILFGGRID